LAIDWLGYSRTELLHMNIVEMFPTKDARTFAERLKTLQKSPHLVKETAYKRRDGTLIPIEESSHLVKYADKSMVLVLARDITKRKQAEKEILAQRIKPEKRGIKRRRLSPPSEIASISWVKTSGSLSKSDSRKLIRRSGRKTLLSRV